MGTAQSREGELRDTDSDSGTESGTESETSTSQSSATDSFHSTSGGASTGTVLGTPSKFKSEGATSKAKPDALVSKLGGLSLNNMQQTMNRVKLYQHVGGTTPAAKWVPVEKQIGYEFVREDEEDDDGEWKLNTKNFRSWLLLVGGKFGAPVDDNLQAKFFDDQLRVDFIWKGVWAMKFMNSTDYHTFVEKYNNCLFENVHGLPPTEENKIKIFGKDFVVWARGEAEDESIWADAENNFEEKQKALRETLRERAMTGVQSLTMGALDNSFLVGNSGIEVLSNLSEGVHSRGITLTLANNKSSSYQTPKKGMLIRGERDMMVLSPQEQGDPHAKGVSQLDLTTGKTVANWQFEKDGTPISMLDVTNDTKSSQLDSASSTFLGLDTNRLVRWDMRDRHGIVQEVASPVLNWTQGHQFARGTNFQCFATTGDGSIVVGSKDGKVRLYSTSSMRQAKTAFPGLGSPITLVDVTYDGKWILATTDTYMILISTVFKDKNGEMKTGFTSRMGGNIAAPRLLKLNPIDAHNAGKGHKFHGGQFSWVTESGQLERNLVVSVGSYTVIWNFRRVKQSNHECYRHEKGLKSCYCYKVVPKEESIVESRFMQEGHAGLGRAPLVVATSKDFSSFNINDMDSQDSQ